MLFSINNRSKKRSGKRITPIKRSLIRVALHTVSALFIVFLIAALDPVFQAFSYSRLVMGYPGPSSFVEVFESYEDFFEYLYEYMSESPTIQPPIPTKSERAGNLCFELGKRTLDIPKLYLAGALTGTGVSYNPHNISRILKYEKDNKQVRIWMNKDNLVKHYPGIKKELSLEKDSQRFYLEWLDAETKSRYLDTKMHIYSDAWYGVGTLKNAKVKYLDHWNLYRVYQRTAIDSQIYWIGEDVPDPAALRSMNLRDIVIPWTAMKIAPRSLPDIPDDPFDYWIANCQYERKYAYSERRSYCQSWFIDDSLLVEFDVKDINLDKIDDIKATLQAHLNEWSRPCTPSYLNVEQSKKPIHPDAIKSVP